MTPTELAQIEAELRAAHGRGKTGEALAEARRLVGDRRAGRGMSIEAELRAGYDRATGTVKKGDERQ